LDRWLVMPELTAAEQQLVVSSIDEACHQQRAAA
jgi:hypothetical protein